MKKLTLLLFVTFIWLTACDKEKNINQTLNAEELKQTVWKGTLSYIGSEQIDRIGIFFISEDRGSYEVISSIHDGNMEDSDHFTYQIDGKGLYIKPVQSYFLGGTWLLVEKTKKKLVFWVDPESETGFVITLNKVE